MLTCDTNNYKDGENLELKKKMKINEPAHEIMVLNHIGDQWRLRWACASAQSRQSLHCSHAWRMEVDKGSDQKSDI